jgi:O-antigen biosynthesis protein WbqP
MKSTYRISKSLFDRVLAGVGIVLVSPILVMIAICILIEDGRPVIFQQIRVGKNGTNFKIKKFRSMPKSAPSIASADAQHLTITKVGTVTRRLSLDELPQLWNILFGDMAFIGPRPALPSQTELLAGRSANGSWELKPGLTGLAQVNGFEGMSEHEKSDLDAQYLRQESIKTDLKVLYRTTQYLFKSPPRV